MRIHTISNPIGSKNNQIRSKEVLHIGKIPVVSQSKDLIDGYSNQTEKKINILPLVMFGDHTRNVKYIDFEFIIGADGTKFHQIIGCNPKYIFFWMQYAAETLRNRGYARHYSLLKEQYIPIPPLCEQSRIVDKLEELLPLFERYGNKQNSLDKLKNDFPVLLKKSILQEAVQGKLGPQDPNDEPASVLLERIRAEKQKLIKEGKIKKDKNESIIYRRDNSHYERLNGIERCIDDEIPFEIPESWELVRLGSIGEWKSGATPSRSMSKYYDGDIPWLKTGDLNDGYIKYIPEKISQLALEKTSVKLNPIGSVLIAMYGATIGKLGILTFPSTTNQACCACLPVAMSNKYLFYFLMSQKDKFIKRSEGGTQPNISKEKIISTLMPLPPLAEQQRIVKLVEELQDIIKEL